VTATDWAENAARDAQDELAQGHIDAAQAAGEAAEAARVASARMLGEEYTGLVEDLQTAHEDIDTIIAALARLSTRRLTRDQTNTVLGTLAGSDDCTDVLGLFTLTVVRLMDPDTNACLAGLPADDLANLRRIAYDFRVEMDSYVPRDYAAEAGGSISPYRPLT
jgi:NADPH-dependent 2,4-dienoyl-CoA reductase/sulfur reductase-like enzyme